MKNMLFIAPKFYSYHILMKKAFEDKGYNVDYYDDRPGDSFAIKALIRLNKGLVKRKTAKYFENIKRKAMEKEYELVLVIYGQSFTCDMMKDLKKICTNAKFVFYMYDPISSMPDRIEFAQFFDKAYTFDIVDFENYKEFDFLPLFYVKDDYNKRKIQYDYCVLTTAMPGKYKKIKEILKFIKKQDNNLKIFNFQFLQSRIVWLYYFITTSEFKRSKFWEFKYKRLSYSESNNILEKSNIIIDCPKEGQSGLTIRTLECLAAGKKMITTNKTILKYDFYRPENFYVYDGEIDFDDIFFKRDYNPIPLEIKEKYSISNWVNCILSLEEK